MKFLLIDNDRTQRRWVADCLRRAVPGCAVIEAADAAALAAALANGSFDLAVSEYRLGWADAPVVLRDLHQQAPDLPVIIFTASGSEEAAVAAFKAGASDYLNAGQRERLPAVVAACLDASRQAATARVIPRLVEILRVLLDHLPLMVAVWGPDGRLALVNPALERTLGWSQRDYLEGEAFSACHPDPLARAEVLAAVAAGYDGWREFRVRTRWGHDLATRWLILRLSGDLRVCIGEDVSRQRQAEERLREQAALLDAARDAILVCDMEDRIVSWNRGAERLYGWAAAEVLGLHIGDVLDGPSPPDRAALHRRLLECGDWHGELKQMTRLGVPLIVDSSQTLLRDADGRPRVRLAINTDLTDKKRQEAQVRTAQRLESVGRLAGGIAHELNNSLTPLRLGVDYLLSGDVDPAQRSLLETLRAGVQRAAELVQRVQSFARGGGGIRRPLELGALLGDLEKMLRQSLPTSIALEVVAAPGLWTVVGDGEQLSQTLHSLAVNARDAMPQGGRLSVRADNCDLTAAAVHHAEARPGRYVRLAVADTGAGMTPEVRQRLFDPFFTTKEIGQGNGLGLAAVHGIVKAHGGFIEVVGADGTGTTFEVYLPAEGDRPGADMPAGRGQWLLVVDDEPSIRELARTVLETFGYRVLTAADGQQALEVFRSHVGRVRLALVDMMMPVLDGPATIHGLRALDPKLAVIAASGLDVPTSTAAAALTLQGFLRKPYSAQALLQAVRKVFGTSLPGV